MSDWQRFLMVTICMVGMWALLWVDARINRRK